MINELIEDCNNQIEWINKKDNMNVNALQFATYFLEQLKLVESRTCNSCRYWNGNEECELLVYDYWVNDFCEDRCMITSPTFSCNKWELYLDGN